MGRPVALATAFFAAIVSLGLCADGVYADARRAVSGGRGGGTILGFADNGAILHENPAAVSRIEGDCLFDATATGLFNELRFSNADETARGRYAFPENPGVLGQVTYIQRLASPWLAIGFGIYVPAGFGTNLERKTVFDSVRTYRSFNAVSRALSSLSYAVTERLSLGACIGVSMSYLNLESPYVLQTGALAGTPTFVDLDARDFTPTFTLGAGYMLPGTQFGISYTGATRFDLQGDAYVTIPQPAGLPPLESYFDSVVSIEYPRSAALGFSHKIDPRNTVAADIVWYDWSSAFDSIGVKVANPENPVLARTVITDATPLEWHDSLSLRLGYEFDSADEYVLRLGYLYHRGPSVDGVVTSLIPAVLEHAFTVGYSHTIGGIDLNFQCQLHVPNWQSERSDEQAPRPGLCPQPHRFRLPRLLDRRKPNALKLRAAGTSIIVGERDLRHVPRDQGRRCLVGPARRNTGRRRQRLRCAGVGQPARHCGPDDKGGRVWTPRRDSGQGSPQEQRLWSSMAPSGTGMDEEMTGRILDSFFTSRDVQMSKKGWVPDSVSVTQSLPIRKVRILIRSRRGDGIQMILDLPLAGDEKIHASPANTGLHT